jgi:hypothetical protein
MARIRLRFVQAYVVNGRPYYYFRKPGCARVKLPGSPGSEPFMAAYQTALDADAPPPDIGAKRNAPGTIAALVAAYAASDTFRDLADETRRTRWAILRRFGDEHSTKRVALLKREHVEAMLRNKRPHPRQNFLKVLRPLLQFRNLNRLVQERPHPRVAGDCEAWTRLSAVGRGTGSNLPHPPSAGIACPLGV